MLLFGGDIDVQHRERLITLDGWIHFQVGGHWEVHVVHVALVINWH